MTPPSNRADRVAEAAREWARRVVDLRATHLVPPDGGAGTLDLACADADPRRALLDGAPVAVSRLFPREPLRASAQRSARAIRDGCRELQLRHGLRVGYLALGIVTWRGAPGRTPAEPLLLRRLDVRPDGPLERDFVLQVAPDLVVNPALLRVLATELGVRITEADLRDPYGGLSYTGVVERLREAPPHVADGFAIVHRALLGMFSYATAAVLDDLDRSIDLLAASDAVAAMAGDPGALHELRRRADRGRPEAAGAAELVLDADASQRAVIGDVLAGRDLLVRAAPGTGRAQTMATLLASLSAHGRSALFVAADPAVVDAVTDRLARVGLRDLVLELRDEDDVAAALAAVETSTQQVSPAPEPDRPARSDDLARHQRVLDAHVQAMHEAREPWGLSYYELAAAVERVPTRARSDVRLDPDTLALLDPPTRRRRRSELREYVELGGLRLARTDSAWVDAAVDTADDAARALDAARRLRRSAPAAHDAMTRAAVEVGLPAPVDLPGMRDVAALLTGVPATLDVLRPEVWDAPLDDLVAGTAATRWRRDRGLRVGWATRRRLRVEARTLLLDPAAPIPDARLHALLASAAGQLGTWRERSRDGRMPRVGERLTAAEAALAAVDADLAELSAAMPGLGLAELAMPVLRAAVERLLAEEHVLEVVPRLRALRRSMADGGLGPLIEDLRDRGVDARQAVDALDWTMASSLLAELTVADPRLGSFDAEVHDAAVAAYRDAVGRELAASAERCLRRHARRLAAARDAFPDQVAPVTASAAGGRPSAMLSDLLRTAPDVLLAARPCWVMPPLVAAQLLPAGQVFDVVVVAGADRLPAAEAVCALARGRQVVLVADDPRCGAVEDGDSPAALLGPVLPERRLTCRYRSRHDAAIAPPSRGQDASGLIAYPVVPGGEGLRLVRVVRPDGAEPDGGAAEVARTVELVLHHARTRPHESLRVVTLDPELAERVAGQVRVALRWAPDVVAAFCDDLPEPFVVNDLDRVRGDERDAVLLVVAAPLDGSAGVELGALGGEGGDHQLRAVLQRARRRITVVSAVGADGLTWEGTVTAGARLLRDVLVAATAADQAAASDRDGLADLDPVQRALAARFETAGLPVRVVPGVGVALAHPDHPHRVVLGVETDGPAYRDAGPALDRDHIRPEQLERLGWRLVRVWTPAWLADPDAEVARVRTAWERAVRAAEADAAVDASAAAAAREWLRASGDGGGPLSGPPPAASGARGPRPGFVRGRPVTAHSPRELSRLLRWIDSDGVPRTDDELLALASAELGFDSADDPRACAVLRGAILAVRAA